MFSRAWSAQVGNHPGLTVEESCRRWKKEFGVDMIANKDEIFVEAVFERDEDYTAFVLKWAQ